MDLYDKKNGTLDHNGLNISFEKGWEKKNKWCALIQKLGDNHDQNTRILVGLMFEIIINKGLNQHWLMKLFSLINSEMLI